jgi:hypothetical protein
MMATHKIADETLARRPCVLHNPAMRGILNIVIGVVMVIGGLSGQLVMRGTNSGTALAVIGGALIIFGLFRLRNQG